MPLTKVKPKGQVTIPAEIRERLALEEGDPLEVTVEDGRIVLTPKEPAAERHRAIDAAIAEGLADLRAGRVTPAFERMEEFEAYRRTEAYRELVDKDKR